MKNVNELRKNLSEIFEQLQNKSISTNEAAELANLAGKMISSAKVQIEYYALRKESPVINFLKSEDK
tara:strand:- start:84 stop:284 length:201 start_codon:yes stop_codon:yes gene_type:complete